MEAHVDEILNVLPGPKNRTELLLKVFHQSRLKSETKLRNEAVCSKCHTPWSLGQFTLKIKPSNHKRKARRKFRIERLQKEAKALKAGGGGGAGVSRKIARLQQQNNHVALYRCFCNTSTRTKVHLWKRAKEEGEGGRGGEEKSRDDKSVPATAAKTNSFTKTETESAAASKPLKKQRNKRNKTAGLIIPPPKNSTTRKSTNINFSKLSQIFQRQQQQQQQSSESLTPQSKLNQFFK